MNNVSKRNVFLSLAELVAQVPNGSLLYQYVPKVSGEILIISDNLAKWQLDEEQPDCNLFQFKDLIEDHVKNIRTIVARTNHFNFMAMENTFGGSWTCFMAIENTFGGGWTCVERHTFKEEITEERLVSVASLIEEIIPTSGFSTFRTTLPTYADLEMYKGTVSPDVLADMHLSRFHITKEDTVSKSIGEHCLVKKLLFQKMYRPTAHEPIEQYFKYITQQDGILTVLALHKAHKEAQVLESYVANHRDNECIYLRGDLDAMDNNGTTVEQSVLTELYNGTLSPLFKSGKALVVTLHLTAKVMDSTYKMKIARMLESVRKVSLVHGMLKFVVILDFDIRSQPTMSLFDYYRDFVMVADNFVFSYDYSKGEGDPNVKLIAAKSRLPRFIPHILNMSDGLGTQLEFVVNVHEF